MRLVQFLSSVDSKRNSKSKGEVPGGLCPTHKDDDLTKRAGGGAWDLSADGSKVV